MLHSGGCTYRISPISWSAARGSPTDPGRPSIRCAAKGVIVFSRPVNGLMGKSLLTMLRLYLERWASGHPGSMLALLHWIWSRLSQWFRCGRMVEEVPKELVLLGQFAHARPLCHMSAT